MFGLKLPSLSELFLSKEARNGLLNEKIRDVRQFTPDMAVLERKPWHFLFVYDNAKSSMAGHARLNGAEKVDYDVFTQNPCMVLERDLGMLSYPIAFSSDLKFQNPPGPMINLKGELFKVSSNDFLSLDFYYQNGVTFQRRPTIAVVPLTHLFFKDRQHAENLYGPERTGSAFLTKKAVYRVPCYMYFGVEAYWEPLIYGSVGTSFAPVDILKAKGLISRYYEFSPVPF